MNDVDRLRHALSEVERDARGLRWAHERPWRVETHVFWEAGLPTVDGHDLSAALMKRALRVVVEHAGALDTGALRVVTGRGRHTLGPRGVLGQVTAGVLGRAAAERGWRLRPHGPAAWVLVIDPSRAPASATGDLGWGWWLLVAGFAAAVALAALHGLGWV